MFKLMENFNVLNNEDFAKIISKNASLVEKIDVHKNEIQRLKAKRKTIPTKITIAQMPQEKRYNKLKQEGKKLKMLL